MRRAGKRVWILFQALATASLTLHGCADELASITPLKRLFFICLTCVFKTENGKSHNNTDTVVSFFGGAPRPLSLQGLLYWQMKLSISLAQSVPKCTA